MRNTAKALLMLASVMLVGCGGSCSSGPSAGEGLVTPIATGEQFHRDVLGSRGLVVVDFYATWCGPCRELAPRIAELAAKYQGRVAFVKIDIDQLRELARTYKVESIPTVIMFARGRSVQRVEGLRATAYYSRLIDQELANLPAASAPAPRTAQAGSIVPTPTGVSMTTATTTQETAGTVTMHGSPIQLVGHRLTVGDKAPDFLVVDNAMKPVKGSDLYGRPRVLVSVPSLDTPVCNTEARRFNLEAGKLPDIKVLVVSMDLPFAQKRWCAAAGVESVQTLSDYQQGAFGSAYGVMMKDVRLLGRAVFVVDSQDTIRYIQVVDEVTNEPDYDAALAAARALATK